MKTGGKNLLATFMSVAEALISHGPKMASSVRAMKTVKATFISVYDQDVRSMRHVTPCRFGLTAAGIAVVSAVMFYPDLKLETTINTGRYEINQHVDGHQRATGK